MRPFKSSTKGILAVIATACWLPAAVTVQSPNGNIIVTFDVQTIGGQAGVPVYSVNYKGASVLPVSRLGLSFSSGSALGYNGGTGAEAVMSLAGSSTASVDSQWVPTYGQWSAIRDHFNEITVNLTEASAPNRQLRLTFRAYDEGVAFSYTLPAQAGLTNFTIASENTEFHFTADHWLRANHDRAQSLYDTLRISQVLTARERPLTILPDNGPVISLAEARMVDYARTRFGSGGSLTLKTVLGSTVTASTPYSTPWRVVFLADKAVDLLNHQYLMENLNTPNQIADVSWIKPGKVIRVTTSDSAGAWSYINFAADMGLQYLEWDAGWYGPEGNSSSDASKVVWPINLLNYLSAAKAKGLGLILYVNQVAMNTQLDVILPLYQTWGVSGVKYGFVNVGTQANTVALHDAVRKAAARKLMVDIHDEYRPTGYSRTYPNLMTQEGIGGDEIFPTPEQTLTFLYSRMLAGAADHTVCYFDARVNTANWTHAYQLAKAVVFYSPWEFLYWYDTPAKYHNEPELEFWKTLPTVWDDTRALQGEVGQYIVMARRKGAEWYLGGMTAAARTLQIPLTFLDPSLWYMAHIYVNAATNDGTATHVRVAHYLVHSGFSLNAILQAAGGQAVRLLPATALEIQTYKGQKPAGYQNDIAVYPATEPSSLGETARRDDLAALVAVERLGNGRLRLRLPLGAVAWDLFTLTGARVTGGGGVGNASLSGLAPGRYQVSVRVVGKIIRVSVTIPD